ncbi:MAG: AMP-dependent synthetase/ligase [Spirochaetaceae bacterium]
MFSFETLPGLFEHATKSYHHEDALNYPQGEEWISYSTSEFRERVTALALGLHDMGVERGERVGIIAPPCPEWIMLDLAVQIAGGVTVPIFKRISHESFSHEVRDSGMRFLFVGNPAEVPMALEHKDGLSRIITFGYDGADHHDFARVQEQGRTMAKVDPNLFDALLLQVQPEDLATIIYTSGSTGLPKGVELTQTNIVSQVKATEQRFPNDQRSDVALSVLPLAHIFERMVMYFYIGSGLPVYFVDDPKRLAEYVARVKPTAMTVVPRILEKVHDKMTSRVVEAGGIKALLGKAAIRRAENKDIHARRGVQDVLFDRLVYKKLRAVFGGRLRHTISGSARLDPTIGRFFINIGIPVYEGYGLTEASPVIAANYPGHRKIGTVGPLFPGIEVRSGADGEILAAGPNIMRGYHNNPKATEETITPEGWLRTGDLGHVDEDGYLVITGRKKELLKKSTGEYVPPQPIERAVVQHPLVDTAVIFADNRAYVTCLVFPDMEELPRVKEEAGYLHMTDTEFLHSDHVDEQLREHIEEVNRHRHHSERIERFHVMDHAASIDTGELTPTFKVRRFHIEEMYRDLIEEMYGTIRGWK